jgi:rapamycin-insensitive companion of mTOR
MIQSDGSFLLTWRFRFQSTIPPPHFYGEITKTEEGCNVLREKGHFPEFARYIRQHAMEASDTAVLLKLKSALWAVVSIACSLSRDTG